MNIHPILADKLYQEELYQIPPRLLVIIPQAWENVDDANRLVLQKMIGAVKLNFNAIQIITRKEFTIASLAPLAPSRVLALGASLSPAIKPYEFHTLGGTPIIVAESLEALDDAKKKTLWLALKQMFAL